jgi:hypothetical protein
MNEDFEEIKKLMALKRYEQPPRDFVDDFLREFHHRQRQARTQRGPLARFWEALTTRLDGWATPQWTLAGAAIVALVAAFSWLQPATGPATVGEPASPSGMVPVSLQKQSEPPQDLTVRPFIISPETTESAATGQVPADQAEEIDPPKPPQPKAPFSTSPQIKGSNE